MRPLLTPLAILALCSLARAQVTDGSTWTDSAGNVASVDVTDTDSNPANVTVTVTDATGFTPATTATASSGSTAEKPKAQTSGTMETRGGTQYRIKDGKLQKKVNGKWVNMTKTKKKKGSKSTLQRLVVVSPPGAFAPNAPPPIDPGLERSRADEPATGEEGGSLPGPGSQGPPTL